MGCAPSTPVSSTASLSQDKENVKSDSENQAKANGQPKNSVQNDQTAKQNGIPKEKSKDTSKGQITGKCSFTIYMETM